VSHLPRGYNHYISSCHQYHDDVTAGGERKLDRLKTESKGATNKAPTCALTMNAPQKSSRWQGVREVSSACEVGC